nr:MAG TPA: repressor protein [Caudoviricetes sp.]
MKIFIFKEVNYVIFDKIKQLCDENGITIGQLEKELEFGFATIRKWENSSPGVDKLKKVADYFEVTVDYFL